MDSFKTVKGYGEDEFIEKKSRFIGQCRPVKNQDDALAFIAEMREVHPHGTITYAYVLREENTMRYSDGGEPSGTAGVPILEVIKKEGLTDVCVVVTRYYGGIQLGAGGLVRAFSKGAKIAVDAAKPAMNVYCSQYLIRCDYTTYGKLEYVINAEGHILKETAFENDVCMTVAVENGREGSFLKTVTDTSGGSATVNEIPGEYIAKEL